MIEASECFVAPVSMAAEGAMTLVLPRSVYERQCLVIMRDGKPTIICLDEDAGAGAFFSFQSDEDDNWQGVHIPNVRIELDVSGLCDAQNQSIPVGTMVRTEDKLTLRVKKEGNYQALGSVTLLEGLPNCAPRQNAYFLKWQIVLGEGSEKRVLHMVDVTPKPA